MWPSRSLGAVFALVYRNLRATIERLERDPILRLAAAGIVIATAVQIWFDLRDRQDERAERRLDAELRHLSQIATAWQLLTTRSGGDIGRGVAANTLFLSGYDFSRANFSCDMIGVLDNAGDCYSAPVFSDIRFVEGTMWDGDFPSHKPRMVPHENDEGFTLYGRSGFAFYADFRGAIIDGMVAESLLRIHLSGVEGHRWLVRSLNSIDDEPFSCLDCTFIDSVLTDAEYRSLNGGALINSTIGPSNLEASSLLSGHVKTLSDHPAIFLSQQPILLSEHPSLLPDEELSRHVVWERQSELEYCVTQEDFTRILPAINHDPKQFQGRSLGEILGWPELDEVYDNEYMCGFSYFDVEILVVPRLIEQLRGG